MTEHNGIELTLICQRCSTRCQPRPYLRATKWGTLRLQAATPGGWYVDGAVALCARCAGKLKDRPDQRETWSESDRHAVEREQDHEADMDALIERNPGVVSRVLDAQHQPYGRRLRT